MKKNVGYIKARIKTYKQLLKVYPEAKLWGKPISMDHLFPSADEVILPYLGKTVLVRKRRRDLCEFYYEIKESDGLIVMPEWIDYFDSENLVPCAEWKDYYNPSVVDDTWLDYYEERYVIIDEVLIVTG